MSFTEANKGNEEIRKSSHILLPLLPSFASVALLFFLFPFSNASATAPHLASIMPTGAQRGTELEISFQGDRLQDAEEVICYEPGLQILKLNSVTNKLVAAQVKIAADCRLGEHLWGVRTTTVLSELRTFFVGQFPVLAENEPKNELAKA